MNKLTENPKEYYHITSDENGKPKFKSADMHHRFGNMFNSNCIVRDNKIQLRPQSCGNPTPYVNRLDTWIRAINYSYGVECPQSYKDSAIRFDTIDDANSFLDAIYSVINKPSNKDYYSVASFVVCGNSASLPKGVIKISKAEGNFKFFQLSDDLTSIKKYDFEPLYNKIKLDTDDLYLYNFKTKKLEPNKKHRAWSWNKGS